MRRIAITAAVIAIVLVILRKAKRDSEHGKDSVFSRLWDSVSQAKTPASEARETTILQPADYSQLAAAIEALAAGTRVPPIYSVARTVGSGLTEVVPKASGERIALMAYAVTTSNANTVTFWSGNRTVRLWQLELVPAAGTVMGANLSASWPTPIAFTNSGEELRIETTAGATVSVSYWTQP